jgi:MFS family permease
LTGCPTAAIDVATDSARRPAEPAADACGNEWRIIGLTSVGHALCHISELTFAGVLVTLIAEFRLEPDRATLLGLAGYVLFGVGALPAGLMTDRWGSRRVLIVYFFWMAAAAAAVALTQTTWALAAALTLLGAAISLYHPAGLAMIAHGCRARGRAMGINGVAGSMGVALGPALGVYMAAQGQWRLAYALIAAVSVLAGLAMIFIRVHETPVHDPPARPRDDSQNELYAQTAQNGWNGRGLWLLFAAMMLGGFNYRCLLTALPAFLAGSNPAGGSMATAGTRSLLILALGGIGQLIGGHIADRARPARLYVVFIVATIPFAALMAHGSRDVALTAAALLAVFMFAQQPTENTALAQMSRPQRRSTLYGLKFVLTFGVGALGAQLVGILWKKTGSPGAAFDVFAGIAAVMAVVAAWFAFAPNRDSSRGNQPVFQETPS